MLKHQINSTLDSQDTLESIESILNEAVAFESVLYERSKTDLEISHAFNIFIYAFVLYIYI